MSIDGRARSYGKIWGGWTIGKMLGQGSGGKTAVFKLSRTNLTFTEECAMKVINIVEEQLDYGEVTEDYRNFYNQRKNELRRMAEGEVNLMHQLKDCYNVVQYLDFDFNDWQEDDSFGTDLLIRMVLLGNLNTKMKKSSCTEDEIIQVGIDICTALEGCYAHNIIHRDIKPDNIFMNEHSYLLGDFGISRIIKNGMTAQTNTGTAHYAAPEQFKQTGLAVGYDYRVDIYSLGLTLYVLANKGRLPFTENLYNTQLAIQLRLSGKEFPMLEGVNFKLQEIIFKACSFKAEDRYKNATEMKKELIALKDNYVVGDNGGGYETEPALLIENSFETQPALSLTNTGFETESALSTENVYETQPALSATSVGYETEPVLSTPAQREEPKQEIYKAPALKMEKVETTIKDNSLKSEIEDAKSMDMQLSQPEAIDNLDYKVMAHDCIIRGDYNAALDAFLKAIEQGEWNAMYYEVKQMFSTDREIKKNAELAVFWYQNCITYGKDSWTVSLAEYQLGEIYAKGIGVKKDHKYAEELFSKSASKGNPYAKKKFVAGKYVK